MSGKTLLLTSWGQPALWRDVVYVTDTGVEGFKCCTSLLPLLKSLNERIDVVIVILDSLMDKLEKRLESPCYRCYENALKGIDVSSAKSYEELKNSLSNSTKEFIGCLVKEYGFNKEIALRKVVVGPAVGSPGGNWMFEGNAMDYEAIVLEEVSELCFEEPYQRLVLDLTHGINFMPSILMRLAHRLASILLVAHEELKEVRLTVYNSDPVSSVAGEQKINLNVIVDEIVKNIQLIHRLPPPIEKRGNIRRPPQGIPKHLKSMYYGVVKHILSSLYYPSPLALYEFTVEERCEEVNKLAEEVLKLWLEHVEVDHQNLRVKRWLSMCPDSVYAILLSKAVCKRLGRHDGLLDLACAEKLAEVYGRVHEALYELVNHELSKIKCRIVKREIEKKPEGSGECVQQEDRVSSGRRADKRIMIAHAGFQECLVEINPHGKMKYIKNAETILREAGLLIGTSKGCKE